VTRRIACVASRCVRKGTEREQVRPRPRSAGKGPFIKSAFENVAAGGVALANRWSGSTATSLPEVGRLRNFARFELLSHGQMLLEVGKCSCRPFLQFGIIPTLGIRIKKRDCSQGSPRHPSKVAGLIEAP
jgi:hypothetical protein